MTLAAMNGISFPVLLSALPFRLSTSTTLGRTRDRHRPYPSDYQPHWYNSADLRRHKGSSIVLPASLVARSANKLRCFREVSSRAHAQVPLVRASDPP